MNVVGFSADRLHQNAKIRRFNVDGFDSLLSYEFEYSDAENSTTYVSLVLLAAMCRELQEIKLLSRTTRRCFNDLNIIHS